MHIYLCSGIYDFEYINYVIQILLKCRKHSLKVFIDPHQDTVSQVYLLVYKYVMVFIFNFTKFFILSFSLFYFSFLSAPSFFISFYFFIFIFYFFLFLTSFSSFTFISFFHFLFLLSGHVIAEDQVIQDGHYHLLDFIL